MPTKEDFIKQLNEQILQYIENPQGKDMPEGVTLLQTRKPKMSVEHKIAAQEKKSEGFTEMLPTLFIGYLYENIPRVLATDYKLHIFKNKESLETAKKRINDFIENFAKEILKEAKNKRG